jgi:hypothetical protein
MEIATVFRSPGYIKFLSNQNKEWKWKILFFI